MNDDDIIRYIFAAVQHFFLLASCFQRRQLEFLVPFLCRYILSPPPLDDFTVSLYQRAAVVVLTKNLLPDNNYCCCWTHSQVSGVRRRKRKRGQKVESQASTTDRQNKRKKERERVDHVWNFNSAIGDVLAEVMVKPAPKALVGIASKYGSGRVLRPQGGTKMRAFVVVTFFLKPIVICQIMVDFCL